MATRLRICAPLLISAVLLTSGCVGVVPVKNVESDKVGYLTRTFTLESVPGGVASQITAKDNGTLPFHRMVLSVTPHFAVVPGGGTPPVFHSSWTLINAGGPFVQTLDEQTSNGVDTRQDYGITYRNFLTVREQVLVLNRTDSSFIMQIKGLQSFTPLAAGYPPAGGVDIHYEWGNPIQIANLSNLSVRCDYGARYPASRLNPKLVGEAQELNCQYTNKNGIVTDRMVRALLTYYGVTVLTRKQTSTATVDFRIDDAIIS
jgi:hypothetical protein